MKITFENKVGVIPRAARINQVQDLDLNEIKEVVNTNYDELVLKLSSGGYVGTAETLRLLIINATTGVTGTSITPSSLTFAGTGIASAIALTPGQYPNHGGMVVNSNSIAVISRDVAGAFSIGQTAFDISSKVNVSDIADNLTTDSATKVASSRQVKLLNEKIAQGIVNWTAKAYLTNDQVNHLGKDWVSNAATLSTDVPGTSSKWVERLTGYLEPIDIVNKADKNSLVPFAKDLTPFYYYNLNNSPAFQLGLDNEWSWSDFAGAKSGKSLVKQNVTNQGYTCVFQVPYSGFAKEIYLTFYFNPAMYISASGTNIYVFLAKKYSIGIQTATTINKFYEISSSKKNVGYELSDAQSSLKIVSSKVVDGVTYNKAVYRFNLEALSLLGSEGNLEFTLSSKGELGTHRFFDIYATTNLDRLEKEYYVSEFTEKFVDEKEYNLANASMRGDFTSANIDAIYSRFADKGVAYVFASAVNGYQNTKYGLVNTRFKGYGIEVPAGVNMLFKASTTQTITFGFWLNKTRLNGDNLRIFNESGAADIILNRDLSKGIRANVYRGVLDFKVTEESVISGQDTFIYIQFTTKIMAQSSVFTMWAETNSKILEIYNLTSFVGDVEINPFVEHPTLYKKFNSHLVGKTVVITGDSNGGGSYGNTLNTSGRRFAIAGKLLGLKIINAANGGWAMQSRMTNNLAPFNWLYYHAHRDKIKAIKADIYYFNKCTNDSNQGAYPELVGGASYGVGSWSEVKNVIEKYEVVRSYLIANNTSAIISDGGTNITVANYCKKYFTTLGCTGAFIIELSKLYPEAISVIDSTIFSTGYVNYLLGGFSESGIVLANLLEENAAGNVIFPPFLLSNLVNGLPTSVIINGTKTGGAEIAVTSTSTLSDGNNYNLYKFYAYSLYTKVVGTNAVTAEENTAIKQACNNYYNTNPSVYGRLTPELTANLSYPLLEQAKYYYNDRKDYLASVSTLTNWLNTPFLDVQKMTGVNLWSAVNIAGDSGHFNLKGHKILGKAVASLLNDLGRISDDNYLKEVDLFL